MNIGEVAGKAALYITELGRIKMYRNSHLKFINNTGRYIYYTVNPALSCN